MRRFYFLMIFMLVFILHQNPQKVQALDEETRIPAGVSLSRFKLISQPTFSEAYNGFGERVPLHSILIRDEQLKDWTTGSISAKLRFWKALGFMESARIGFLRWYCR